MSSPALTLTLKNDLSELARIAEESKAHGESRGWPSKWILHLNITLDELITNIVSYGYPDAGEHEIRVTVTDRNGELVTVLEDDGVAFNPFTQAREPDLHASVAERRIGGLGVYFAKTLMDHTAYERIANSNHITLILRSTE
jgi:anti-sigma regulatory factor (Ser/Thr protein kinase)